METLAQVHIRHRKELRKAEAAKADMTRKLGPFFAAAVKLLAALDGCEDVPGSVTAAAGELRKAAEALGVRDM